MYRGARGGLRAQTAAEHRKRDFLQHVLEHIRSALDQIERHRRRQRMQHAAQVAEVAAGQETHRRQVGHHAVVRLRGVYGEIDEQAIEIGMSVQAAAKPHAQGWRVADLAERRVAHHQVPASGGSGERLQRIHNLHHGTQPPPAGDYLWQDKRFDRQVRQPGRERVQVPAQRREDSDARTMAGSVPSSALTMRVAAATTKAPPPHDGSQARFFPQSSARRFRTI